jgi:PAS domain S-box-containing protein
MRTRDLSRTNAELSAENLERQWTNQALEHQLHYNQVIINSVDDFIFVVTKALNITRINPAVTRGTGLEEKALLGKPLGAALGAQTSTDPAGAELSASLMQSLREGRDLLSHPVSLRDLRGKMLSCQLNFFPLRDDNKVVGGVAILRAAPGGSTAGVS